MRSLSEHLSLYAQYHRDPRNIYTHFAGIPLIVISVIALLAIPLNWLAVMPAGLMVADVVLLLAALFYLRLDLRFGALMLVFLAICYWLAMQLIAWAPAYGWVNALAVFVLGWGLQFIGHYYEGKKPAFIDDLSGLVIGPLFIVAEWCFLCGFAKSLEADINAAAGPVRVVK